MDPWRGWGGGGVQRKPPCKEGKAAKHLGEIIPNLPQFTLRDLHRQGLETVPASVSPSISGMLVMQSTTLAEPFPKASPVQGATPFLPPGTGATGVPALLSPSAAASPPMSGSQAPLSPVTAATSSLLNQV